MEDNSAFTVIVVAGAAVLAVLLWHGLATVRRRRRREGVAAFSAMGAHSSIRHDDPWATGKLPEGAEAPTKPLSREALLEAAKGSRAVMPAWPTEKSLEDRLPTLVDRGPQGRLALGLEVEGLRLDLCFAPGGLEARRRRMVRRVGSLEAKVDLGTYYTQRFRIRGGEASLDGFAVESPVPAFPRMLLDAGWAKTLFELRCVVPGLDFELAFDGQELAFVFREVPEAMDGRLPSFVLVVLHMARDLRRVLAEGVTLDL